MLRSTTFDAIGVTNQVTVVDGAALDAARDIAVAALQALDRTCSRFREDSELSRLNRQGSAVVSPRLFELVRVAVDAARSSGGAVDPTIGPALRAIGYDRDFDAVVHRRGTPRIELVAATGWRSVRLDPATLRISLAPGTELDLGATAKAFAADRIAAAIAAELNTGTLIALGGDIAVAGEPPAGGWPIAVAEGSRAEHRAAQTIAIKHGAVATSSTTVRRWRAGAEEVHHIVDPATGAPAPEVWRTVSVAAKTCLAANVAATTAIVRGDAALGWLESLGLSARLVRRDGCVVYTAEWPAARVTRALAR